MVSCQLRLVYVKCEGTVIFVYERLVIFVYERLLLGEYNIVIWMLVIIINVLKRNEEKVEEVVGRDLFLFLWCSLLVLVMIN